MLHSVIVACITGGLAVLGAFVGNVAISRKKARQEAINDAKREERQNSRLESIEKKLDIHNGYAEKFGDIQKDIAVIKNDIEHLRKENKNG